MPLIPIWPGSSSFSPGTTPFGFYDTDGIFQTDADKVAKWCATRMGYPIVNIELQSGSFYAAFEEAVTAYGNEIYQYKIRENYLSMEGNPTSSTFNDQIISPSLGNIIRIAQTYGTEAGSGGNVTYRTGSVSVLQGQQDYDLNDWAVSASISGAIEIKRVLHEAPGAMQRYFDPFAGVGTGPQAMFEAFGFGNMSPGISFMMMPVSADILKVQAIEFNDQVRRSGYSFDLVNNQLRIFPIPAADYLIYFHYIKVSDRDDVTNTNVKGQNNLVSNVSKVPYTNPVYSQINSVGRQWIYQYSLAISKEMLGYIRKKYVTIPIPGSEVTLNGDDLINAASKEKEALITQLRDTLEQTSRRSQLEKKSQESGFMKDQLNSVPLPIYIF